jgi:exopolysaccharide biosynthesis polyprenyl glycosylphosphotransferase
MNPIPPARRGGGSRPEQHFVGGLWVQVAYALIDITCIAVNCTSAFFLRFSPTDLRRFFSYGHWTVTAQQPVSRYGAFLVLYVALLLLFCQWQDLYWTPRTRSAQEESLAVAKAVFFATLVLTAFIYLSGVEIVSRLVVTEGFLLNAITLAAWRYAKRKIVIHRVEQGIGARNVVIIGAGRIGQALARQFDENKFLGYRFRGFLDGNHSEDPRLLGTIEDLTRVARAEFVDEVFVTIPSERELVKRVAVEARQNRLAVKVVPDLYDGLAWNVPVRHIGDFPVMDLCWRPIPALGLFCKRMLDLAFSIIGLAVCTPLLTVLAAWVKLDSPGPVFYGSQRAGKKGRVFSCYKLRTMAANADALKDSLRHRNEREGPFFKIADDPRVTRAGRFLRKYSLDELPQLVNVLKGDMSLVGPRPHPVDEYERYTLEHLRRLDVKPGVTGLWQVTARHDPSFEKNMALDLEYIENWNFGKDVRILLLTIPVVCSGKGR